uniref:ATP synthase F0 subunit 8 n=1 Tax=Echiniscus testudo TaxID=399800 RepID=A0A348BR55_ECHTS|nr:ATP synthase F0 subunit 8 [Echiniscus testudo]
MPHMSNFNWLIAILLFIILVLMIFLINIKHYKMKNF